MSVDIRPRKVWTGLTIPGKKMMAMISSQQGLHRGQALIDLYKEPPYRAFIAVAFALHELQRAESHLAIGPRVYSKLMYGVLVKDLGDFLKLRFRASGLRSDEAPPSREIADALVKDGLLAELTSLDADLLEPTFAFIVNYVVTALDPMTKDFNRLIGDEFGHEVRRLRDILRDVCKWVRPDADFSYLDKAFADETEG